MMLYCSSYTVYLNLFELYTDIIRVENLSQKQGFWICIVIVLLMVLTTSVCSLVQENTKPLESMDYPSENNCEHESIKKEYEKSHESP